MNKFDSLPSWLQSILIVLIFLAVCTLVDSIGGCSVAQPVVVPCDTDMDCQIKNPHLGVY